MAAKRSIERLAIANRGEAALRCIRAVKSLRASEGSDLRAIALYTPVDRDAPFVRHADMAVLLPAETDREVAAYLDHDRLIEALHSAGADAVWPGWGFVAEDPSFVERLEAEDIAFLGPGPDAMRRLGDKISSKGIAEKAGVPVTPWSGSVVADAAEAAKVGEKLGFPLMVKASAGGGGRGIRVVDHPEDLAEAFASAASEASTAFGDDRLFMEQKVSGGRHIEVQIAADCNGHTVALGCRDCSVQRRHQKVLEEAPPPGLAREFLAGLESAAVRIAREVGYCGVGTVEFLVVAPEFHFLEMNPRLQVEHGITEACIGIDLVELQIRIARGESLEGLSFTERGTAIEARVCAEDPDAGFLPAPGRIARFDPALGPRVRIDTGVAAGSTVPASFDSLIAKVIATGRDRNEARARLACALLDFDLVIEGGATNKGFLLDVLDHHDYRAGGVDTEWLDRFCAARGRERDYGVEALIAAAILSYQSARLAARHNLYRDASNVSPARIPPSRGQQIDLSAGAESYRLEVFAVGAWRYRVHCDERVVEATLREEGSHTARLAVGGRTVRVLYDRTDSGLRVEVEGRAHTFSNQAAGEVRAGTPAVVVAVNVAPGDAVKAGQRIGVLEAMKMEIGFDAPVSGVVKEVRAKRGQQVAAGDVLLVIEESSDGAADAAETGRLQLFELPDRLAPLFADGGTGVPDLAGADAAPQRVRRGALAAAREEIRRVILGYDANPERAEKLADFFQTPLPDDLSEGFLWELAEIRRELKVFSDIDRLFIRAPSASVGGELGPSNDARLRMFVRRLHAAGAGINEDFLDLVRRALTHYDIEGLEHADSDELERAVLRLLSAQLQAPLRHHLILGVIQRVAELAERGVHLVDDRGLENALGGIAGMRGLVTDAVADAAADAAYAIFERPRIERLAERTSKQLDEWLATAESEPLPPPEEVLLHLADAPRPIFDRVGHWLSDADPRRRRIATASWLRRLYSPEVPAKHRSTLARGGWLDHFAFPNRGVVLAATCAADAVLERAQELFAAAATGVHAVELIVPVAGDAALDDAVAELGNLAPGEGAPRLTLTLVPEGGPCLHHSFDATAEGLRPTEGLHGIHPEAARRMDLARLANFEIERVPAENENIYCLHVRSREMPSDERIFILADARSRSPDDDREVALHVPAFEHSFYEATGALRGILRTRDPKRRLQWNRVALFVAPAIFLDDQIVQRLSRRLAPATRNLGLEKVVVRLQVLDRESPDAMPTPMEFVISDITGANMEIRSREPHTAPLASRSDYERRIVEARRRRLIYPYEIVRMLTGMGQGPAPAGVGPALELPVGSFEEYDLDENDTTRAVSVAGRPYGRNACGIVFGIVTTPTRKVPEGMSRVLVLSDPTFGMGSLAAPECDRVVAALNLAEERGLPVEWIPVSSGAKIAMDSGTENLDATARVVRRIVQFTQNGGSIHLIVTGVNVGAQSYWDALATMLMHNRGALIMTPRASMVLTGRAALEASGAVSAEDEPAIGGFEHIMGPNGEAQYFAQDLADAYRILYQHYEYTYVVPGEKGPRRLETADPATRSIGDTRCEVEANGNEGGFETVGEIFDNDANPGRKRPFPMRAVMQSVIDTDGRHLERWRSWSGAETAIVWDAHIGGAPVCLIGIESTNVERAGYRPADGPPSWNAGTLFPLSSKKVARAINAASGNRPLVVLANLSGFDGSPESMRKLQLEYGAEIARAVVNFEGPIVFLVVSRYHGGAYVVFSQELNPNLKAAALEGSYASVIGGGPAAAVVFGREVRARALADPEITRLERESLTRGTSAARESFERTLQDTLLEKQAEVAAEFDRIHSVERAREVGSLSEIVAPADMRAFLIDELTRG
ncbi:MAG: ATP-grasp domain-containing protein [Deltaproteobacteria bacterium]|nr:ATP-grasp domain-containing protein [Deltaproteobacteria bacterium]MBW2359472.1 ATP-grasp domain-containing protein [Deltaproteobacteria bacterium]